MLVIILCVHIYVRVHSELTCAHRFILRVSAQAKKLYLCVFVCVRVHAFVSACMCVCEPARALLRVMCVKG